MNFSRLIIATVFLLLWLADPASAGSLKLALFGDPHYGSSDVLASSYNHQIRTQTLNWMQDAFDSMAARGFVPDLTGSVGDNNTAANSGEETSLLDAVILKLTTGGFGTTFSALGNHDFEYATPAEVRAVMAAYYSYFEPGELYGSFDAAGWHIVVLDTNYDDTSPFAHSSQFGALAHGYVPQTQLDWLTSDLAASSLPTLIFAHHTLAEFDGSTFYTSPTSDFDRYATTNRSAVRTILEADGDVVAVFEGHQHFPRHMIINNVVYIDLPTLVGVHPYPTRLLAGDKGIWTEVEIDDVARTIALWTYEDDSTNGVQLANRRVVGYGGGSPSDVFPDYQRGALTSWTVDTTTTEGVPQDIVLTNAPATGLIPEGLIVQGGTSTGTADYTLTPQTGDYLLEFTFAKAETNQTISFKLLDGASEGPTVTLNASGLISAGGQTTAYTVGQETRITLRCDISADTYDVMVDGSTLASGVASAAALESIDTFRVETPAGSATTTYLGPLAVHYESASSGVPGIDGVARRNIGGVWQ